MRANDICVNLPSLYAVEYRSFGLIHFLVERPPETNHGKPFYGCEHNLIYNASSFGLMTLASRKSACPARFPNQQRAD
jgi:hypothetical protein